MKIRKHEKNTSAVTERTFPISYHQLIYEICDNHLSKYLILHAPISFTDFSKLEFSGLAFARSGRNGRDLFQWVSEKQWKHYIPSLVPNVKGFTFASLFRYRLELHP
ncbi:hypothetical protein ABKN59_011232 [Abortiporus biennis]